MTASLSPPKDRDVATKRRVCRPISSSCCLTILRVGRENSTQLGRSGSSHEREPRVRPPICLPFLERQFRLGDLVPVDARYSVVVLDLPRIASRSGCWSCRFDGVARSRSVTGCLARLDLETT